ncbi:MAG: PD-(D/E)XK nuclease family protein, partial [Candidatus Riflebacteria bacterium]
EKYRIMIPPASHSAFIVSRESIRRDALEFFDRECQAAVEGKARPVGFELSFGMPLNSENKAWLESEKPVSFAIDNGARINLKGRLDRVDENDEGVVIWDYKTGSARDYQPGGARYDQALLQLAIYKFAVSRMLQDKGDPRKVIESGLYFPTVAGQGQRITLDSAQEEEIIKSRLDGLFDFLVSGSFPADTSMCPDCNAKNICPYAAMPAVSQEKGDE